MKSIDFVEQFDKLRELAQTDLAAFEAHRQQLLEAFFASVPNERQQALRQQQWTLDGIRRRKKSPWQAASQFQEMALELLAEQQRLFQEIADLVKATDSTEAAPTEIKDPVVVPFKVTD